MDHEKRGDRQGGGVNINRSTVHAANIAGRDVQVRSQITSQINEAFQPVFEAIRSAPAKSQPEAVARMEALQQEAAKGAHADHSVMTKLADGLIGLVPGAVKALATTFAQPVLSGVAGPLTQFLLNKMLGQ